jgi:hypothetical protein
VSLAKGLRESALPLGSLFEAILGLKTPMKIVVEQDNAATMQIVSKGRSPALRHLAKTHCVSLAWVAEVCSEEFILLKHCPTLLQLADSFTKAVERAKFLLSLEALQIR